MPRGLVSFAALLVLAEEAACAPAAAPSPDATHRPVASITGIINCGYPESVARLGLTWTTHYLPGDAPRDAPGEGSNSALSLPRARVEITNRSGVPHVVRFARSVLCSIDRKCSVLPWSGIDRTLAPDERFVFDVDARMSYVDRVDAEVIVVSVEGDIDGQKACVDVGAWLARAGGG